MNKSRSLVKPIITTVAVDLLETERRVTIDQIVFAALSGYPDEFDAESDRLVREAARGIAKKVLRRLTEDDKQPQLALPGLALPSAIAIPDGRGFTYIRSDKAEWPDLVAGRQIRFDNVTAAQAKLDGYDETLLVLQPHMENAPGVTVAEAFRLIGNAEAA